MKPGFPTFRALAAALTLAAAVPSIARAEEAKAALTGASSADRERARALFLEGMDLYDEGSFGEAIARFRESYDLVPSPNSRLMTARSLRKLGRVREAWDAFEIAVEEARQAAAESDKYAPTLQSAVEERAALREQIGLLTVEVDGDAPEDAVLMIAGRQTPRNEWGRTQAVSPGRVELTLIAPSLQKIDREVEIAAGGEETVRLEVQPQAAPAPIAATPASDGRETLLTMAYVSGGVGAAGLALFGVVLATDGNAALGVTGLVMGAVGLGMGIALYAVAHGSDASAPRTTLVAGPGSVGLVGAF
jgi:hypothetical protein